MADRKAYTEVQVRGRRILMLSIFIILVVTTGAFHAGWSENAAHQFLRITGRIGLALFISSFGASTLQRIFRANWTRFLIVHRRYLGISTALILWAHVTVILSLVGFEAGWQEKNAPLDILVPGGSIFVLVGLMALTSNSLSQHQLGKKNWKRLHTVGGYAALGGFIYEYVLQLFLIPEGMIPTLAPAFAYLLLGIGIALLVLRLMKNRIGPGPSPDNQ